MPEIKTVCITTRQPRDENDPGQAEVGFYSVESGVVIMRDEKGKPTGKRQKLEPGEDAHMIAGRMVRSRWLATAGKGNFNRPLGYSKAGVA